MASYLLISFLFILSCSESQPQDVFSLVGKISNFNEIPPKRVAPNVTYSSTLDDWNKMQDSLRNHILKSKPDQIVKNSLFQEFYIRGIAEPIADNLVVKIPFNVHTNDCGAPDCYTTEVEFQLPYQDTITLPKSVKFSENETGCIDQETRFSSTFDQVLHQTNCVIYYCQKYKRALALVQFPSSHPQGGWNNARYFTEVDSATITAQMALNPEAFFGSNETQYPYTSWTLNTTEYEMFTTE